MGNRKERRAQKQFEYALKEESTVGDLLLEPAMVLFLDNLMTMYMSQGQFNKAYRVYRNLDDKYVEVPTTLVSELRETILRVSQHLRRLRKDGKIPNPPLVGVGE